jgi:hypothetical protein
MSAFLGPIHFWLYNKIQIQQELVEDIVRLAKDEDLEQELTIKYGESEKRPLEEVIDQGNIHGWLQGAVSQVEYKLAYAVTKLLDQNPNKLEEIKQLFQNKGEDKALGLTSSSVKDIFQAITDSLLDGMPCDHANIVLEESDDSTLWKRNNCVHKDYWNQVNGDINNYYLLRESFIEGFISKTKMSYTKVDEVTSMIERSA